MSVKSKEDKQTDNKFAEALPLAYMIFEPEKIILLNKKAKNSSTYLQEK